MNEKKIIIIGGSSGLGRHLAELYARNNLLVGVIARRAHLLKELQSQFPRNIITKCADISDNQFIAKFKELTEELKGVDIVIVTASVIEFPKKILPEISDTININVAGFYRAINIVWNYFSDKKAGQIVAVTSIAAARGNKNAPDYHASKAFQSFYLESLRVRAKYENKNISICEIIPGYINTDMGKGDRLFWVITAEKAAQLSARAIAQGKSRAFIPKRWWLVFYLQRLIPTFLYDRILNGSWTLGKNKP